MDNGYLLSFRRFVNPISTIIRRTIKDGGGVTAIEYALIAGLIAMAAVAALTLIGTDISNTFSSAANNF
jgi:pilus assembly protein Flp/PilA